jgi:hypothetical protein
LGGVGIDSGFERHEIGFLVQAMNSPTPPQVLLFLPTDEARKRVAVACLGRDGLDTGLNIPVANSCVTGANRLLGSFSQ